MRHRVLEVITLVMIMTTSFLSAQDSQDFDEQEFANALFADIGVSEMELMQFGVNMVGAMEPYQQYMEENQANPTRENYVEVTGHIFDHLISPMINDIKTTAADSFSEDQYSKMMLRLYQVAEVLPEAFQGNGVDMGGLFQLFLLPDVVPMTEEQVVDLLALQKELITDMVGIETILKEENAELFAEQAALFEELEKAESDEKRAAVNEKLGKVMRKTADLMKEPVQKVFANVRGKLDTLQTAEQKGKLAQIKQNMPDYLKKALAQMQTVAEESKVSAAWRPNLNSWMPGQGVPQNWAGHPGETRPEKSQKGRPFPE